MSDPVVVITGAARRIGAAIARKFHSAGYNLVLHCNQSRQKADALCEQFNTSRGDSAAVVQADLFSTDSRTLAEACLASFGRVNHLINNASVFSPVAVNEMTAAHFDQQIATNLRAPFLLSCQLADALDGGSIINIVDIYAKKPLAGYSAYSISKAGLAMSTKSLALELAPGVRVNGIAPGAILWPEGEASETENWRNLIDSIPLGRLGLIDDIADAALYLAKASYVTGHILTIDGGSSLS